MSNDANTITIQLLDKTLQVRCPADKAVELQKCAILLDTKMREVAASKTASGDRLMVLAALNAVHELFLQQNQKDLYIESLSSHIRELQNKIVSLSSQKMEKVV